MAQDDQINIRIGVTGAEESRAQITGLSDAFTMLHGGLLSGVGTFQSWILTANQAIGLVQQLVGGFQMLLQPVEQVGQALMNVAEQMNNIVGMTGAVTDTISQAFGQSAFDLNKQTERNFFNWAYLYGGPAQGGVPIASELARWSQQASLRMPYTRQDLMSAITTLAVMPGMTPTTEETDLSLLSDVASTQGRPGLTLQWAAMAALRGGEGYGRMLLMDLNLSESTMKKYGYDKSNPATFFPALQAYEAARQGGHYSPGSIGQAISTETFWGAQTSFVDRIQNTLLQLGGWNNNATTLTGDVRQGSIFGILKQDLVDVSAWMDAHSQQLQQLADVAGKFFGGITGAGGTIFGGLFDALGKSGIGEALFKDMSDFAQYLAQPNTQAALTKLGELFGNLVGQGVPVLFDAIKQFFAGLGDSGALTALLTDLKSIGDWLGVGSNRDAIQGTAYMIGHDLGDAFNVLNAAIVMAGGSLGDFFKLLGDAMQALRDVTDPQKFIADIGQMNKDMHQLFQDAAQSMGQFQAAQWTLASDLNPPGAPPPPGGPAGASLGYIAAYARHHPGSQAPPINLAGNLSHYLATLPTVGGQIGGGLPAYLAWYEANEKYAAGGILGGAAGGSVPHTQGQAAAQDFATGYITKAQTLMSQQQTSDAIVQPFVNSLQRSIQNGSDLLATTMLHIIQQETQKQLAVALSSRDALGNLAGRAVGGQRFGTSPGFQ